MAEETSQTSKDNVQEAIAQHKEFLEERIDPDSGLLDLLLANGTLSRKEIYEIKNKSSYYIRNSQLLDYILCKHHGDRLITALRDVDQIHIANYLSANGENKPEFGGDWPLTSTEISILDINEATLVDILDVSELLVMLYSSKVINKRQLDFISSKPTYYEKSYTLLEILRRRSLRDYLQTIKCLHKSCQSYIADILEEGGVVVRFHAEHEGGYGDWKEETLDVKPGFKSQDAECQTDAHSCVPSTDVASKSEEACQTEESVTLIDTGRTINENSEAQHQVCAQSVLQSTATQTDLETEGPLVIKTDAECQYDINIGINGLSQSLVEQEHAQSFTIEMLSKGNGTSIASTFPVTDGNVSNSNYIEQDAVTDKTFGVEADSPIHFNAMVETRPECNIPIDGEHKTEEEQKEEETTKKPSENGNAKYDPIEEEESQGSARTLEEEVVAKAYEESEDNQREGKRMQECTRTLEEDDVKASVESEDCLRKGQWMQESTSTLEEDDVKTPVKSEDSLRKEKWMQESTSTLEEDDVKASVESKHNPREGKRIQEATKTLEGKVHEKNPLESGDNLKEETEQETKIKCIEDSETDVHLMAEDLNLRFRNTVLESSSFEISATYSKETARQLLFEWLRGQDCVTSYYYGRNEITIHVKRGATQASTIETDINGKFPQLRHTCRILYSDPGVCVPCARSDNACISERGEPVQTPCDEEITYPGKEISCGCFVPGQNVAEFGTFAGKICGYGITAGHIIGAESEGATMTICLHSQMIGIQILSIKDVSVPIQETQITRKTLGDLLFFRLNDQHSVTNLFYGDPLNSGTKEIYDIVLHRGPVQENDEVMAILRDEKIKFGRIKCTDYNDRTVSNTFYIVDDNDRALTVGGDSGAIIVLRPKEGEHVLKAVGVVTHLHWKRKPEFEGMDWIEPNAENSVSLGTIAIRLYDVLLTVQRSALLGHPQEFQKIHLGTSPESIEFSGLLAAGQQFDSGIQVPGSLENPEPLGIETRNSRRSRNACHFEK